jgi:hypothetical protein
MKIIRRIVHYKGCVILYFNRTDAIQHKLPFFGGESSNKTVECGFLFHADYQDSRRRGKTQAFDVHPGKPGID